METTTRKKLAKAGHPSTLSISVERREGRSLSLSIRGSTVGVLLALVLIATVAWLMMR